MNLKNQKGITMVAEVLTIVVFVLLVGTITYSSMSSFEVRKLNSMYADILTIQEKAANYYLKNGEAPINQDKKVDFLTLPTDMKRNPNDDTDQYYRVDFSKLVNVSLNNPPKELGEDPSVTSAKDEEYYFINAKTLTVYFNKGVEIKGLLIRETNAVTGNEVTTSDKKKYYTLPDNYTNIEKIKVDDYKK